LAVEFLARLREVKAFASGEALQAQIRQDVERTQEVFSEWAANQDL
jgi:FAD synthase